MFILFLLLNTPEECSKAEALYYQYRKLMKYLAKRILEKDELAEEAVHDAIIRVMENLHRIDEVESEETKAFIVAITKNIAIDLLRKEKRQAAANIDDHLHLLKANTTVLETVYVHDLMEKVLQLPVTLREPLELYLYFDLSGREIAKKLGISEANVRKRLQRARKILAEEKEGAMQ